MQGARDLHGTTHPQIAALFILSHETRPANRAHSKTWCYATGRHLDLHARAHYQSRLRMSGAAHEVEQRSCEQWPLLRVSPSIFSLALTVRENKRKAPSRELSNPATATTTASAPAPGRPRLYKCPPCASIDFSIASDQKKIPEDTKSEAQGLLHRLALSNSTRTSVCL
jgi:hypothetical protein